MFAESLLDQTYCTSDDYEVPTAEEMGAPVDSEIILLVRRGLCMFWQKVFVAQDRKRPEGSAAWGSSAYRGS